MKEISLTRGHKAIVDDADYEWLSFYSWCASVGKSNHVAAVTRLWSVNRGPRSTITMHRLILKAPVGIFVDHINGDSLDNRRQNLRFCTHAQNMRNRKPCAGKDLPKGVNQVNGRYRAQIAVDGKQFHVGYFATPEAAGRAYDAAALRLHGEFARTNFQRAA